MKKINELQVCFFVSLIVHSGLIGAGIFNVDPVKDEKPFEVEFEIEEILPEQYEIKEEKKTEKPIIEKEEIFDLVAEEKIKPKKIDEEIKKSLLRYQDSIKQKIQQEKRYPRWALRAGHEGDVRISFNILSSGEIRNLELVHSSNFEELDKEALDAVRRARPFLSFPEEFKEDEIKIEIDIVFIL